MITWESHRLLKDDKMILPYIGDHPPSHDTTFAAKRICLDLTPTSRLSWNKPDTSSYIFWDCDLGLKQPFEDAPQHLSLKLALEHLSNHFLPDLLPQTLGLNLYQGTADFSQNFPWTPLMEENLLYWLDTELSWKTSRTALEATPWGKHLLQLFCRDVFIDYLHSLIPYCPPEVPLFLTLHSTSSLGPLGSQSLLLSPEAFKDFILITDISSASLPYLHLESIVPFSAYSTHTDTDKACVLPSFPYTTESLHNYNTLLTSINTPFKQIPEESLHLQWEGINSIHSLKNPHLQTQRKLQGFAATGGHIEFV